MWLPRARRQGKGGPRDRGYESLGAANSCAQGQYHGGAARCVLESNTAGSRLLGKTTHMGYAALPGLHGSGGRAQQLSTSMSKSGARGGVQRHSRVPVSRRLCQWRQY